MCLRVLGQQALGSGSDEQTGVSRNKAQGREPGTTSRSVGERAIRCLVRDRKCRRLPAFWHLLSEVFSEGLCRHHQRALHKLRTQTGRRKRSVNSHAKARKTAVRRPLRPRYVTCQASQRLLIGNRGDGPLCGLSDFCDGF
jgi:hypothetical protein